MIYNVTSGRGINGATLTVTAPAGVTVTVSKGAKTKSKTTDSAGKAVFRGLESGTWTVTITNGSQSASRQVVVTSDYTASLTFFSARIAVAYPAGSVCICSNGSTTLTAPDTSGSVTFNVDRAGTWTVKITSGTKVKTAAVEITASGQSESVEIDYLLYLYDRGDECTAVTGGWQGCNESASSATGTFTAEEAYLSVKNANNASYGAATVNAVDMTDYTTLHAIVTRQTSAIVRAMVGAAFPGTASGSVENTVGSSETELSLDITEINGKNKVLLRPKGTLSSALFVHRVWLS